MGCYRQQRAQANNLRARHTSQRYVVVFLLFKKKDGGKRGGWKREGKNIIVVGTRERSNARELTGQRQT